MTTPPYGLCVPVRWHAVRRADQIELIVENRRRVVDLLGCRAPGPATPDGQSAAHWLEAWLESTADQPMAMWIPLGAGLGELMLRTCDARVTARVFCGTTDLAELLVAHGLAEAADN